MTYTIKHKTSSAPEDNYTVAACDRCKATCPESKLPGREGVKASEEADQVAKSHGWAERFTSDRNPRRRKMSWTVELLCPGCQGAGPEVDSGRQPRCE